MALTWELNYTWVWFCVPSIWMLIMFSLSSNRKWTMSHYHLQLLWETSSPSYRVFHVFLSRGENLETSAIYGYMNPYWFVQGGKEIWRVYFFFISNITYWIRKLSVYYTSVHKFLIAFSAEFLKGGILGSRIPDISLGKSGHFLLRTIIRLNFSWICHNLW